MSESAVDEARTAHAAGGSPAAPHSGGQGGGGKSTGTGDKGRGSGGAHHDSDLPCGFIDGQAHGIERLERSHHRGHISDRQVHTVQPAGRSQQRRHIIGSQTGGVYRIRSGQ